MVLPHILKVSELTACLKQLLEKDARLANLWVRGEISNLHRSTTGHFYFTLKDAFASLRCVFFRGLAAELTFEPENGKEVVVRGYLSIFEKSGQYQLYVQEMQPGKEGELYAAYLALKQKLEGEGLFDAARKRPLPFFPRRIGIVTSLGGAALRDLVTIIRRCFPPAEVVIAPALVQGENAAADIVRALNLLNDFGKVEVIIVGRGGGSFEELQPFNEEKVVRTIAGSAVPVISAVGHERDYTLADFAADARAPTPSAAAQMVVPNWEELQRAFSQSLCRLESGLGQRLAFLKEQVSSLGARLVSQPKKHLYFHQQLLDLYHQKLVSSFLFHFQQKRKACQMLAARLDALSPLAVLDRGYAICLKRAAGRTFTAALEVSPGEEVETFLRKGAFISEVKEVKETLPWQ